MKTIKEFREKFRKISRLTTLVRTGLTALLIGTGCASNLPSLTPAQERGYATKAEAARVLNIPQSKVCNILGGYKASELGKSYLKQSTLDYAEIKGLIGDKKGIIINEDSFVINPLLMREVAENADTHKKDMIITDSEARDYALKVGRESLRSTWGLDN